MIAKISTFTEQILIDIKFPDFSIAFVILKLYIRIVLLKYLVNKLALNKKNYVFFFLSQSIPYILFKPLKPILITDI